MTKINNLTNPRKTLTRTNELTVIQAKHQNNHHHHHQEHALEHD